MDNSRRQFLQITLSGGALVHRFPAAAHCRRRIRRD
jgi:hypothetical protein